ncbi:hypothetical protein D3C83_136430 [compost metagenome]
MAARFLGGGLHLGVRLLTQVGHFLLLLGGRLGGGLLVEPETDAKDQNGSENDRRDLVF